MLVLSQQCSFMKQLCQLGSCNQNIICEVLKVSNFSGMCPLWPIQIHALRAARHCNVVWFIGWIKFLAISFLRQSKSLAVCLCRVCGIKMCTWFNKGRFMMSGWLFRAAIWRDCCHQVSGTFHQHHILSVLQ